MMRGIVSLANPSSKLVSPGAFFNEFVLRASNLESLLQRCAAARIVPGVPLGPMVSRTQRLLARLCNGNE